MRALMLIATAATFALFGLALGGAAEAQSYGSWCQTPDGGCVVAPPQPLGSYCVCGASSGAITG